MNDVPHSSLSARNSSKNQIRSSSIVILSSHSCILADPAPAVCLTHYAIQWDLHELIKWLSFRNLIITLFATDTLKYQAETRSPPTFAFISTRSFMLDSNPRFSVCSVSFYPCRPTWPTHHSSHLCININVKFAPTCILNSSSLTHFNFQFILSSHHVVTLKLFINSN